MDAEQPFEIRESDIAGKGAFAQRAIAQGERIIEYVGERITHEEADLRYDDDSMEVHYTYLFTVSSKTCIDATREGNDARYINHSCDPNCESEIVRGRVYIVALRDIVAGEELHYDYAYERSGDETDADEARYRCLCGTPPCRGSIMESLSEYRRRMSVRHARRAPHQRQSA
jgi:SET domain-containing protein